MTQSVVILVAKKSSFHHLRSDLRKFKHKIKKTEIFFLNRFYDQAFYVEILKDLIPTYKPSGQGMLQTTQLHPVHRL
jgi:hypothetical protein